MKRRGFFGALTALVAAPVAIKAAEAVPEFELLPDVAPAAKPRAALATIETDYCCSMTMGVGVGEYATAYAPASPFLSKERYETDYD